MRGKSLGRDLGRNASSYPSLKVYYESMERKLLKPIYECRCNGILQTKRFTRLTLSIVVYYETMKRKLI
jgi:hypothetical protein